KLKEKYRKIDQALESPEPSKGAWESIENAIQANNEPTTEASVDILPIKSQIIQDKKIEDKQREESHGNESINDVVQSNDTTIQTIESLPGFEEIINDLLENKERLDHRTLTVALFGAFSAGKSSFANALLGDNLLPSSPNPTTAVINRISPIT